MSGQVRLVPPQRHRIASDCAPRAWPGCAARGCFSFPTNSGSPVPSPLHTPAGGAASRTCLESNDLVAAFHEPAEAGMALELVQQLDPFRLDGSLGAERGGAQAACPRDAS